MGEMKSLTLNDKKYDGFVDPVARAMGVINSASGESITATDSSGSMLLRLNIYGKTTQNGTPSPDAPVELVSVGESGSIIVNVAGESDAQNMAIATPNGLPGIPVDSGGNYTDANGQQWICDEVDLARGVYIQRTNMLNISEYSNWNTWGVNAYAEGQTGFYYIIPKNPPSRVALCNILPYNQNAWGSKGIGVMAVESAGVEPYIVVSVGNNILADVSTNDAACASLVSFLSEVQAYMLITIPPIETPLSAEEIASYSNLHTYRGNTTVSNDAGAWMELEYVMDAKKYIDSLIGTGGSIIPATVE